MRVQQIGDWTLEDRLADGGRPLVVMFQRPDGLTRHPLRSEFRSVAEAHPRARFYEVDLLENPSLIRKYALQKPPVIVVFVDGVEVARHVGTLIETTVDRILGPCHQEEDES